jgi:predicted lipoprotein with Yx(FWY)xxD motif
VLTALALTGWGVRAAGTPRSSDVARNSSVPLAQAPNQAADANNGQAQDANNGQAQDANNGQAPAEGNNQPTVGIKTTKLQAAQVKNMGEVAADAEGFTMYRFDKDKVNSQTSACEDQCAKVWPPVLVDNGQLPELVGIDAKLVSTFQRKDGGTQVAIGGWAMYRYIGDQKAGQWKGQGVGKTWWVSTPEGKKNLTCVPTGVPKAVAPPADNNGGGNGGGNNSGGGDYNSGGGGGY